MRTCSACTRRASSCHDRSLSCLLERFRWKNTLHWRTCLKTYINSSVQRMILLKLRLFFFHRPSCTCRLGREEDRVWQRLQGNWIDRKCRDSVRDVVLMLYSSHPKWYFTTKRAESGEKHARAQAARQAECPRCMKVRMASAMNSSLVFSERTAFTVRESNSSVIAHSAKLSRICGRTSHVHSPRREFARRTAYSPVYLASEAWCIT